MKKNLLINLVLFAGIVDAIFGARAAQGQSLCILPLLVMAGASILGGMLGKQKAPQVAPYTPIDAQAEQKKSLAGNLGAEGDIEQLLSKANGFTQDQANSLMEKAMPGYSKISSKLMGTADSLLTNPYGVPEDVSSNLTRLAAERGISVGSKGQTNDFSLLRDFGINSMQYGSSRINQAQGIVQAIAGMAPRVNPLSPMSLYITPAQQVNVASANEAGARGVTQAGYNASAAASNANASMWGNIVSSIGGYAGAAMAGGSTPNIANVPMGMNDPVTHVDTNWSFPNSSP